MGFFDRFNNKANRGQAQATNNPLQTMAQSLQRMWSKPPKRDNAELPDLAHRSPRLDPIFIIGRAVASTPWNIYNKIEYRQNGKTSKPLLDHPLYDLLDRPIGRYPEIDWYSLCYSTIAVIKAVGGYYWLKVRDQNGNVVELDPIPPAWVPMQPTIGNPYYTVYPIGVTASKALIVSPDDIIRFKRPDLSDPYGNGRGDSEQLEDEFQIDEFSAKAEMNLLYNDATPPYIITAPGMPQDQAEAFKKSWMQKLGGYLHRREPGVLGFDAKIQTLAMSPVEMDLMESRKFIREEVYQHYQIPPEIYGNIENSNRATIQSAEYLFHKNVLNTEYRFLERVIDRQLVQVDFDRNLCFRFDDFVPEDEDFKLATLNAGLTSGVVQVDEWRKAFDLPELPNGKGKVFLRTFAQYEVPADGSSTVEETPPNQTAPTDSGTSGQTEDKPTEDSNMAKPEDDTAKAIIRIVSKSVTDSLNCDDKTTIRIVSKYNDNHDESGRFSSGDSSGGSSSSSGSTGGSDSTDFSSYTKENYADIMDNVSKKQLEANLVYSNMGFTDMNHVARGDNGNLSDSEVSKIKGYNKQLNSYISNNTIPQDAVLHRGFSVPNGDSLKVGQVLENSGFSSFTSDKETAVNFSGGNKNSVIITVKAKAGSTFAPAIRSLSGKVGLNTKEAEFIGKSGMKFRVTKETGTIDHFTGAKIKSYEVEIYE